MRLETKFDRSVYYFIKDLFTDVNNLNVVDEFPTTILTLPTISVEASVVLPEKVELGNRQSIRPTYFYIDIFAQNKVQRDEFAYRILEALDECISVYDYDEGFPPNANPTKLGCLQPDDLRLEIIRILPELVDKLYYRSTISFLATYNKF